MFRAAPFHGQGRSSPIHCRRTSPEPTSLVESPRSILLIRPSALGDVCRSVPLLASLRAAYPAASIEWLVQDTFADAVAAHPALSATVPFERARLGRDLADFNITSTTNFLADLRRRRYDLVIDAQGLFRSGMLALATLAPRRVGYANAQELGWLGYTERHHVPRDLHAVDRMLRLLALAGIPPIADMRLHARPEWRVWSESAIAAPRYAVIAPTSRWPGKRWPAERFTSLAESLLRAGVDRVALVGAASERSQCAPLLDLASRNPRVVDLIGKTSVGRLMAVVEGAALVIANDSAALHMAVGFDRPLIALYGPTRVSLVGPYLRDRDVIQHVGPEDALDHKNEAAGRALMERIATAEVEARALALLGRC